MEVKKKRFVDDINDLLDEDVFPQTIRSRESHEKLLKYLHARLCTDMRSLEARRKRFEKLDKALSTWKKKSKEDAIREAKEAKTGEAVATTFNIPIMHTYIEDLVSFYSQVFAPQDGSFFSLPQKVLGEEEPLRDLTRKLNADAKQGKYYQHLTAFVRSCLVYNVGGFHHTWETEGEQLGGRNLVTNIDMYNFAYDQGVSNLADLPSKGTWAAIFTAETLVSLFKREKAGVFQGIQRAFDATPDMKHYKRPPVFIDEEGGLAEEASGIAAYISASGTPTQLNDEELELYDCIEMYAWVNPEKYELVGGEEGLELWRFVILNNKHIVRAEPHTEDTIPFYCTQMNKHTLQSEQKSFAEHIKPFQQFISFLANTYVKGTRSNIHGLTFYDPMMYDMKQLKSGTVSAYIPSMKPGTDLRAGVYVPRTPIDTSGILPAMGEVMRLMNVLFPTQALPSQVASIDRAVKSQVAAVMQGVNKRLHMHVRDLDAGVMLPMYMNSYRNLVRNGNSRYDGVQDDDVLTLLGTGLMQLNKESAEEAMRQLLFALIQNPQTAQNLDFTALMNRWASLLGLNIELEINENDDDQVDGNDAEGDAGAIEGGLL